MAVQGTFYRTETQRLGVTPVSPPNAVDNSVTPLNPPGSNPVHDPVTLGIPANGLSLVGQQLSIGLASSGVTGVLSGADWDIFNNKVDASTLLNYQPISEKGQPNGYVPLDAGAKISETYLPDSITGQVEYIGTWNASTNSPTLANPPASTTKGHYYIATTAGTQFGIDFNVGDWIISNGSSWAKVDNTDAVTSVFGRLGNILAVEADYQEFYPRLSQTYANPTWISSLAWSKITGAPTTLSGYGITDAVPNTRTVTAGAGLTGGGALSADRTLSFDTTFGDNRYVTLNTAQTITGSKIFNTSSVDIINALRFVISTADNAHQRADSRDDATNFARLHWFGVNDAGANSNFRHAWYDGAAYVHVTVNSGGRIDFTGSAATMYIGSDRVFDDNYHPNADVWTTARTITIGSTGKSVNGSANVSWSLAEIGAAATSHTHTWSEIFGSFRSAAADTDILPDSGLYRRSTTNEGFIWHGRLNGEGEAVQLNLGRENQGTLRWRDIASDLSSYSAWKIAVDTARTISAGNGLTGGGTLAANRTLTLGTPSTLTASTTNAVTATSHTHEITTTITGSANTIVQTNASGVIVAAGGNSGEWNLAFSWGDHRAYNGTSNFLGGGYIAGGLEKPNWSGFGAGKLKLQMLRGDGVNLGSPATWNDVLWLSSYTGADVKQSIALVFGKTSEYIGFVRQDYDAADWGTIRTIWHTGNLPSPIQGSGTTNLLAKFTGAGSIGNSLIFDNGNSVLIGTTSELTGGGRLQVNGTVNCDDPTADRHAVTRGWANSNLGNTRQTSGTWSPVLSSESGSISLTYTTQTGNWTRIGNRVFFDLLVSWSAKSGTGGDLRVSLPSGLNINAPNDSACFTIGLFSGISATSVSTGVTSIGIHNTNFAEFRFYAANGGSGNTFMQTVLGSEVSSPGSISLSGSYTVA